ncbi:MAG: Ig domain-containing protein [Planctomycetota bacterium]
MSKRERFLAIAVGVVIALFVAQYAFNKVSTTLAEKQDAIDSAIEKRDDMDRDITTGMISARKLDQLKEMSLPSDEELAFSQYRDWLFELGLSADMKEIDIDVPQNAARRTEAYSAYNFTLRGNCRTDRVIELLSKFYDQQYLHSVRNFKMAMTKEANIVQVTLDTQAIAMTSASPKQERSRESSGRLAMTPEEYKSVILNRNPFAPPNSAPSITNAKIDAVAGTEIDHEFEHKDAEDHKVTYVLKDGQDDLPAGLKLTDSGISWTPEEAGKHELTVMVTDDGWPSATSEEKIVINVEEPKVETPEEELPALDVATQAFVSGIMSGRLGKEILIRSRLEDRTLSLQEGSEFELGDLKGRVLAINNREGYAEIESGDIR